MTMSKQQRPALIALIAIAHFFFYLDESCSSEDLPELAELKGILAISENTTTVASARNRTVISGKQRRSLLPSMFSDSQASKFLGGRAMQCTWFDQSLLKCSNVDAESGTKRIIRPPCLSSGAPTTGLLRKVSC